MKNIPGVDMSSGALGQGISAAVGMAISAKLSNEDYQAVNTARSTVNNAYTEQINKWLKGTEAINDTTWNNYVTKMKKSGVDTIVSIIQKYAK